MQRIKIVFVTVILSMMMTMTALAGQWRQNNIGWWYQNDDGGNTAGGWQWIDGKCYYFNSDGYMLANMRTPDGYLVGMDGAWITDVENTMKDFEGVYIHSSLPIGQAEKYGITVGKFTITEISASQISGSFICENAGDETYGTLDRANLAGSVFYMNIENAYNTVSAPYVWEYRLKCILKNVNGSRMITTEYNGITNTYVKVK